MRSLVFVVVRFFGRQDVGLEAETFGPRRVASVRLGRVATLRLGIHSKTFWLVKGTSKARILLSMKLPS